MTNYYKSVVIALQDQAQEKWSVIRPTTVSWNDIRPDFRPVLGQPIRIREAIEIQFERLSQTSGSATWLNRFYNEAFVGHFQIVRLDVGGSNTGLITERGQIIGNSNNTTTYKWQFQREYDLHLMPMLSDVDAAVISSVVNCNADLRPAAVFNDFINFDNAQKYLNIAYAIYSGDTQTTTRLLREVTSTTIDGYRFADDVLFRTYTKIPTVDLSGFSINTALGDIYLWVHPDWKLDSETFYTVQIINNQTLTQFEQQYQTGSGTCQYPQGGASFPP